MHSVSQRQSLDTQRTTQHEKRHAPRDVLPQVSFVSVEYPAILTERPFPSASNDDHPTLIKALKSLSPLPASYASAQSALTHLGNIVGQRKNREIECKLSMAVDETAKENDASHAEPVHPRTNNEIFRHPLLGEFVDTHNIVCKVRKRVWKRTRRDGTMEERKEYTVKAMGITRHVGRFRKLPDYVYDPGKMIDAHNRDADLEVSPSLALHDALRQMDIEGIRSFTYPAEEAEVYEVDIPGYGKASNLRMPPPPFFDLSDTPYMYGFRQNPTSHLAYYGQPDAQGVRRQRYVNRQRNRELAPIAFSILNTSSKKRAVPSAPLDAVKSYERAHPLLMLKLRELLEQQPMWSRRALYNQFKGEERRLLQNQRPLIAVVCYTIVDGCWRDNLVRFGYDPRKQFEARFYQRMAFQRQQVRPGAAVQQRQGEDRANGDVDDGQSESSNRENSVAEQEDDQSHIFDGVTPRLTSGNYLLIDVKDEYVRTLIEADGPGVVDDKLDRLSGWYTQAHYAKIRAVLELRITALRQTGKPASEEACMAIIDG